MSLDNFDELLKWLDPDPKLAGEKFEKIRRRVVKLFSNRGSRRAEQVFDETVFRICEKVKVVAPTYQGDPALYFYGVAKNVHSEFLREDARFIDELPEAPAPEEAQDSEEVELRHHCLDNCLGKLPADKQSLILRFYEGDGQERIENRKRLADELGIDTKALSLRALRIRRELRLCMRGCLNKSEQ
jgi:DNA-directed RNA polymerase specialized sigma24 family protein